MKLHFRRNRLICQNKKFYESISFAYGKNDEVLRRNLRFPVQTTSRRKTFTVETARPAIPACFALSAVEFYLMIKTFTWCVGFTVEQLFSGSLRRSDTRLFPNCQRKNIPVRRQDHKVKIRVQRARLWSKPRGHDLLV